MKGLKTPTGKSDEIITLYSGSEDVLVADKLGLIMKREQYKLWSLTGVGMGVWGMDIEV